MPFHLEASGKARAKRVTSIPVTAAFILGASPSAALCATFCAALGLLACFAACGGVMEDENDGPAQLRLVHASRDANGIDLRFDSTVAFSNVTFGSSSNSLNVDPGTYSFQILASGSSTAVVTLPNTTLAPNGAYTAVVYGDVTPATGATSLRAVVIRDDNLGVASSDVRFQVFHAAPGIEQGDVYSLNQAGGVETNLVPNLAFGGFGSSPDLPKSPYEVGFEANSSGLIIAGFTLPALTVDAATVFIIQDPSDGVYLLAQLVGGNTSLICERSVSGPCAF